MSPARSAALAAVLFDMDGLLVDTEPIWQLAETDVMTRYAVPWSDHDFRTMIGWPLVQSSAYMADRISERTPTDTQSPTAETVGRQLIEAMLARLRDSSGPIPFHAGAQRLLTEIHRAGVPMALVSASQRAIVESVLAVIGRELFPVTVSADDGERSKPAPDPYLLAAERLGVDPAQCVALEDSVTGVSSAQAAGCAIVMVPTGASLPDGPRRLVLPSLEKVDLAVLRALVC
jgi:beta-phosphoglucomutase-like phosphatase (HAD superfamily)